MEHNCYLKCLDKLPVPVFPVPARLNPFAVDGVDISVVLMSHLPYENVKFFTVYGMLLEAEKAEMLAHVHTLVEATSGNTGVVLASMARSFGINRVKLVVAPDLPDGKRYPLLLAGAEIIPPENGKSAIATARGLGGGGWCAEGWKANQGILNLDQYGNMAGPRMFEQSVAPVILKQLPYPPTVLVAGIGTGGTLIGISSRFRQRLGNITTVGVLLEPGDEIPGVRELFRMGEITLPWQEALDYTISVRARPSYLASLWFHWDMGITPGPSSGFAYLGALRFLWQCADEERFDFDSFRNKHGRVHVVVLFPDGSRPYGDRFMANLPYEYLRPSTAPLPWRFPGYEIL